MPTLFDIGQDMATLAELLDGLDGGELDANTESALESWFAELSGKEEVKLDGYGCLIAELQGRARVRQEESDRLRKLAATDDAKAKRLKERLRQHLESTGRKRIDTARYRISLCQNGGKLPLEVMASVESLPSALQRVEVSADTDAIRTVLENGVPVPGCRLLPRGNHVRIG